MFYSYNYWSKQYTLAWKEKLGAHHAIGEPVSVQGSDDTHVYKLNVGPPLARGPQQPSDFWVYIKNWGGEWMWEGIEDSQATKSDLSWLIQGMRSHSLLWVTDGSYDRKRAPTLSGVGWIIFCQHSGKRLVGSFWEKSSSASSYRAEKLLYITWYDFLALILSLSLKHLSSDMHISIYIIFISFKRWSFSSANSSHLR